MKELSPNTWFLKENLFVLFKEQLKKDFDNSGVNSDFVANLTSDFEHLKKSLITHMNEVFRKNNSTLQSLLYRIDISEQQIRKYQKDYPALSFEEGIVELIIKRVLQKVILRKKFST